MTRKEILDNIDWILDAIGNKKEVMCGGRHQIKAHPLGIIYDNIDGEWKILTTKDEAYENIKIIKKGKYNIKCPVGIMKALQESGYKFNDKIGSWRHGGKYNFNNTMWKYCGKIVEDYNQDKPIEAYNYYWEPEWIEEREEE